MVKTKLDTLKEKILKFSQDKIEDIYIQLDSSSQGIDGDTLEKNLKKFGFNEINLGDKNVILEKLIDASHPAPNSKFTL